jgi:serine phosphatase RsbU (regulator of sigma subunit)
MLEDGLPSMNVQGILGDEKNNALWLSTFDGIARFNKDEETFTTYSVNDGIQSQQFADGAYLKTSSGYFLFGGSNGITSFNPDDIVENLDPPKVFITGLKLSNDNITPGEDSPLKKSILVSDEIILSHDQNDISLEYTGIHYSNPSKNNYAYKLENYENDWRYVGTQRTAIYPNLPHGKYTFRVKASNNNDVWNEEGVSLSIVINPPWWETVWAYAAYLVMFLGILGGARKIELKRRKEKENKKLLQLENDRKTKELEEARQLQLSMLPKEIPDLSNLDIAVYMQTATEVGGDYYDFHVGLDGTLTVVLGDATGHGMKAGTMVTAVKGLFVSYAPNANILDTYHEITRCLKHLRMEKLSMCMTMLKIRENDLTMSAAGMPPVHIYRKSDGSIEEFVMKGMPLGTINRFPYDIRNTTLKKGDTILIMSDGLPELMNDKKEFYGYKRVKEKFGEVAKKSPEEIIGHLKEDGSNWIGDLDPNDDVTFVVVKVK